MKQVLDHTLACPATEGAKMSGAHSQINDLLKESKPSKADQFRASLKTTGRVHLQQHNGRSPVWR
jgi:hypothetical protein